MKVNLGSEMDAEAIQITAQGSERSEELNFIKSSRRNWCFALARTKSSPPFLVLKTICNHPSNPTQGPIHSNAWITQYTSKMKG